MPFGFLKRNKDEAPAADPAAEAPGRSAPSPVGAGCQAIAGIAFEGLTEEWRLVGWMEIPGRLSDSLNKREPITISDVKWAPFDGSAELVSAPGLKTIDPVRPDHRAGRARAPCRR